MWGHCFSCSSSAIVALLFIWLAACKEPRPAPDSTLFHRLSAEQTGITFENSLSKNDSLNLYTFDPFYNGAGVAAGDVNNDGLTDLYFTGNMVSGRLYLNRGDFKFEDVTSTAGLATEGWGRGVAMADVNGDGFLDIYVCMSASANQLFINHGDGTFSEQAAAYGLNDSSWATHAAFFDYDKDGDLDLYLITRSQELLRFANIDPKPRRGESENTDKLFRNNGDSTFTEVTAAAGIDFKGNGLGLVISDVNGDSWPDVYVANDQVYSDFLYINNRDGTFTDMAPAYFRSQSFSGMGTDVADFNNDGLVDIAVVDMLPENFLGQSLTIADTKYNRFELIRRNGYLPQYQRNVLQLNNGDGSFSEIGQLAGVDKTDWSWGVLFADLDNDGFKDIIVSNGMVKSLNNLDYVVYNRPPFYEEDNKDFKRRFLVEMERLPQVKIPNYVFRNNHDLTFANTSADWGFIEHSFSYGMVYADLDNDGDLDLVISNVNDPVFVYENNATGRGNNYLRVRVKGIGQNTNALGAKVTLYQEGSMQLQEVSPFRGYQSTVEDYAHFGLGKHTLADSLLVEWPDGSSKMIRGVKANQLLTINYEGQQATPALKAKAPLFQETQLLDYVHHNELFTDFAHQVLLPHKFTENGPCMAKADVNGDGLEDVYVGGGVGTAGSLFMQEANGSFSPRLLDSATQYDETAALFFDADGDGDQDLYLVSGGNAYEQNSPFYGDRLFINNGSGHFVLSEGLIPGSLVSGSCVKAADFDLDGDLDLFVGGSIIPNNFPLAAPSRILQNRNGKFVEVTAEVCPALHSIGLVTDALWTDFDGDGSADLVVAGLWMPLQFYKNSGGRLINVNIETGLASTTGWWQSIAAGDFDGDGDMDFVAGNLGLNSKLKASAQYPVTLYAMDFDQNGKIDPLLFHYIGDSNYPVHTRDRLIEQLTIMRRKFTRYAAFGALHFNDVISAEEQEKAQKLKAETFSSVYIENVGRGRFAMKPLAVEAQFAPVNAFLVKDFNDDGNLDLLLAGNTEATDVFLGYHNAGTGLLLAGDGKGDFKVVNGIESGFRVAGVVKSLLTVNNQHGSFVLAGQYNEPVKSFQLIENNNTERLLVQKQVSPSVQ